MPDPGAEATSELLTRYRAYAEALAAGNFEAASQYVPASKRFTADYSRLSVLSPLSDIRFKKEWFDGEEAVLIVTANSEGTDATGRIKMVRENGAWQVLSEMWNLGGGSEFLEQRDPPRTPAQKDAIRKLEERGFPMPSGDHLVMSALQGNLETVKLFLEAGFSSFVAEHSDVRPGLTKKQLRCIGGFELLLRATRRTRSLAHARDDIAFWPNIRVRCSATKALSSF